MHFAFLRPILTALACVTTCVIFFIPASADEDRLYHDHFVVAWAAIGGNFEPSLKPWRLISCRPAGEPGRSYARRTKARAGEEQALALIRRLGDLRAIAFKLKRSRMTPLQVCEAIIEKRFADRTAREFFPDLPDDERHYWIASLYALLMPKARGGALQRISRRPISRTMPFAS